MSNNSKIVLVAAVIALALAGSVSNFSAEDAVDNTPPSDVCDDFPGFRTNGDPTTITINKGDTVSGKVTAPLADWLETDMATAEAIVKKANPRVYDLGKVDTGAIINVPNCTIDQGQG